VAFKKVSDIFLGGQLACWPLKRSPDFDEGEWFPTQKNGTNKRLRGRRIAEGIRAPSQRSATLPGLFSRKFGQASESNKFVAVEARGGRTRLQDIRVNALWFRPTYSARPLACAANLVAGPGGQRGAQEARKRLISCDSRVGGQAQSERGSEVLQQKAAVVGHQASGTRCSRRPERKIDGGLDKISLRIV